MIVRVGKMSTGIKHAQYEITNNTFIKVSSKDLDPGE